MLNFKFIKRVSFLFVLAFVLFSHNVSLAQEQSGRTKNLANIEIKDIKIQKNADNLVVFATLFNPSQDTETAPFTYLLMLENSELLSPLIEESDILETSIVSADEGKNYATLKPMESRRVDYKLKISSHLPKTLYTLRLGIIKSDGSLLGKFSKVMSDIGDSSLVGDYYEKPFLAINQESCYVINSEGKRYLRNSGAVFEPGAGPRIGCKATNLGNEIVSVTPVVLWKEFFVYGRPGDGKLETKNYENINFNPGESKTVEILLPGIARSQVYQALLGFVDQNNQSMSFYTSFRWTVRGSSARIEKVSLASSLKPSYKKGETMSLSVDYFGSMDLYWQGIDSDVKKLENIKIEAVVINSVGLECGRKTKMVEDAEDGLLKNIAVDVVLEEKCDNPQYAVSILSGEEKLNEQTGAFPNLIKETRWLDYSLFGLAVFAILALMILIRKKKKSAGNILLLALAVSSVFFFGFATDSLALTSDTEVTTTERGTLNNGTPIYTKTYTGNAFSNPFSGGGGDAFSDGSVSDKLKSYYWDGSLSSGFNTARMEYIQLILYNSGQDGWLNFELEGKHEFACTNESAIFKIWITSRDGDTGIESAPLDIKDWGSTQYTKEIQKRFGDDAYSNWGKDIDIKYQDIYNAFYVGSNLKTQSPQIVVNLQQIGVNHLFLNKPYFRGFFGSANDSARLTQAEAFQYGDLLRVIIPIGNLPDPSVTLDANPLTSTFPTNETTLTWDTTDVNNCVAKSSYDNWTGPKSNSGSEIISNLWQGRNGLNSDETHTFTLICEATIGGTVYKKTDSVTVTAAKPTSSISVGSCSLTINKDAAGGNGSVNVARSAGSSFVCDLQSGYSSCASTNESLGDTLTLTPNPSTETTWPSGCSSQSGGNCIVNLPSSGTCNKSVTVKFPASIVACNNNDIMDNGETGVDCGGGGCGTCLGGGGSSSSSVVPVNGVCGTATNYSWDDDGPPISSLCSSSGGNTTPVLSGSNWTWTCNGSNGGSDSPLCSAGYNYNPAVVNLTLNKTGSGTGNVKLYGWRATPLFSYDWNDYGSTADNDFQDGETAGLGKDWWYKMVATPDSGSYFSNWSNCSSTDPKGAESYLEGKCFVTMDTSKTATVKFELDGGGGGGGAVKAYILADFTTTDEGSTRILTWASDNATSCKPTDGDDDTNWTDTARADYSTATGGTYTTKTFGSSGRTYGIECTNGSEAADASVSITVPGNGYLEAPTVTFWADPDTIDSGEKTSLEWLSSNSTGCYLFQPSSNEFYIGGTYYNTASYYGPGYYLNVPANGTKDTVKFYNTGDTAAKVYPKIVCKGPGLETKAQTAVTVNPAVSDFTFTNTTGAMTATIVEGLSANSSSIDLALNRETIGNVSISGTVPAISGAKAQFSSDDGVTWNDTLSIDISVISQIKVKAINIPGATATGTYNVALTAKDVGVGGITKKLNVPLQVKKVSSEWKEF